MNDHSKSKRRIHWIWWLLGTVVVLAVGSFMGVWWYNVTGMRVLNDRMAEARADGGPVTWEEIVAARPTIPDEDNAALLILDLAPRMEEIDDIMDDEDGPYYRLTRDLFPPLGHRWSEEKIDRVSLGLWEFRSDFERIDELAEYEGGAFPITIKPDPIDMYAACTPFGSAGTIGQLTALNAMNQVMQGKASKLERQLEVLSTLSRVLGDTPSLVTALVMCNCDGMTAEIIENALAQLEIGSALLKRLEGIVADRDVEQRLLAGMHGDRASFIHACKWVRADPASSSVLGNKPLPYANSLWFDGMWARDLSFGLGYHNLLVKAAKDPARYLHMDWGQYAVGNVWENAKLDGKVLSAMLIPNFDRSFAIERMTTARIRCCRVGLALERYRIDHAGFPDRLEALVPDYIEAMPQDVLTDEPLRYYRDELRAVVYSTGWDGQDDGGPNHPEWGSPNAEDWGFTVLDPSRRGLPPVSVDEEGADMGP